MVHTVTFLSRGSHFEFRMGRHNFDQIIYLFPLSLTASAVIDIKLMSLFRLWTFLGIHDSCNHPMLYRLPYRQLFKRKYIRRYL
jgi:hypothetical protein